MSAEKLLEDSKKETLNESNIIKIGSLTVKLKPGESNSIAASIKRPLEDSVNSIEEGTPEIKKITPNDAYSQIQVMPQRNAGGDFIVEEYSVPDHMVGVVIGRGGEQIIRIQTVTGCKIQFASDSGGAPNRACMLAGRRESVQAVKTMIEEIISKVNNPDISNISNCMDKEYVEDIMIPGHKVGLLIGKGGENIRNLQDKGGVKMKFIQDKSEITLQDKPLRISGEFKKVECAKRMVVDLLAQTYMNKNLFIPGPSIIQEQVMIPRKDVGVVIGTGGDMIQRIQQHSGAKVQFIPGNEEVPADKFCLITGTKFEVQKASCMINDLIENVLILVPKHAVGFVIGKSGDTIKKIEKASGTKVQFIQEDVRGDKFCQITGTMDQVKTASSKIRYLINEALDSELSEKVKVILLISYIGRGSFGFKNWKRKWKDLQSKLEEDFLMALLLAGVISDREFNSPKLIDLQGAVDTEKSISAARNFVSLMISVEDMNDLFPNKINLHLPPDIRICAMKRVSTDFYPRDFVARQTYSYMLPTFALAPTAKESIEEYRINENRIEEVNEFFETYVEELHFYNCLSHSMEKRIVSGERTKSVIKSCECTSPFELCGIEFCLIKVTMQTNSEIISLVRQVVGLAIAVMRNLTSIIKCFMNEKIEIPRAPGFSIFLEEAHSQYFEQIASTPDDWFTELPYFEDSIEQFKQEHIYLHIAMAEQEGKFMLQWLSTLNHHRFDVRNALEPKTSSKLEYNRPSVAVPDSTGKVTQKSSKSDSKEKCNTSPVTVPDSDTRVTHSSQSSKLDDKKKYNRFSVTVTDNTRITHLSHSSKVAVEEKFKSPSVAIADYDTKVNILSQSSESDAEEDSLKCDLNIPQIELGIIPELKSIQDIGKSIKYAKTVKKNLDQVLHRKAKKK